MVQKRRLHISFQKSSKKSQTFDNERQYSSRTSSRLEALWKITKALPTDSNFLRMRDTEIKRNGGKVRSQSLFSRKSTQCLKDPKRVDLLQSNFTPVPASQKPYRTLLEEALSQQLAGALTSLPTMAPRHFIFPFTIMPFLKSFCVFSLSSVCCCSHWKTWFVHSLVPWKVPRCNSSAQLDGVHRLGVTITLVQTPWTGKII